MASVIDQPPSGQKKRKADIFSPSLKNRLVAVVSPQPQTSCREEPPLKRRKTVIGLSELENEVATDPLVKNASSSDLRRHRRTLSALNVSGRKMKNLMYSKKITNVLSDGTGNNSQFVEKSITKKQSVKKINKTFNKCPSNDTKSKIPVSNNLREDKNQNIGNVNLVSAKLSEKKKIVETKGILMKSKLDTVVKTLPTMQKGTKKQNSATLAVSKINYGSSNTKIPNRNFNVSLKNSVSSKKSGNVKALSSLRSKMAYCRSIEKSPIKKKAIPKTLLKSIGNSGNSPLACALSPSPVCDSNDVVLVKTSSEFRSSKLSKMPKQLGKKLSLKRKKFSEVLPANFNFSQTESQVNLNPEIVKFSAETCVIEDRDDFSNDSVHKNRTKNLGNSSVISAVRDVSTGKKISALGTLPGSHPFLTNLQFLKNCNSMVNRKSKKKSSLFKLNKESPPPFFESLLNLTEREGSSQMSHVRSGFENLIDSCSSKSLDNEKSRNMSIVRSGKKSKTSSYDSINVSASVKTPQLAANEGISVLKSVSGRKKILNRNSTISDDESVKLFTESTPKNKSFDKCLRKYSILTPKVESFFDIDIHNSTRASKPETSYQFAEGSSASSCDNLPIVPLRKSIRKSGFSVKENNSSNILHGSTSDDIYSPATGSRTGSDKKSVKKHSLLNDPQPDSSVGLSFENVTLPSEVPSKKSYAKSLSDITSPLAHGKSTDTVVPKTLAESRVDSEHLLASETITCLDNSLLLRKSSRKSINSLTDVGRVMSLHVSPNSRIYVSDKKSASEFVEDCQSPIISVNDSINASHAVSRTREFNEVSSGDSSDAATTSMNRMKSRPVSRKSRKLNNTFTLAENTSLKTLGFSLGSNVSKSIDISTANSIEIPLISTSLNDSIDNSYSNSTVSEILDDLSCNSNVESGSAFVTSINANNLGSGSRKSTLRNVNLFNDAEMASPKTPNEIRSSVNRSPIKSVKKSRGSQGNSLINNLNSIVVKTTNEFEDSLDENLTDLKDISPVNISKLGSARKSVRKSGNVTIDFTPGGEIFLPHTNSASRTYKRSSMVSTRKSNESVNNSGITSVDSDILNEFNGNSDVESSNAGVTSLMNVSYLSSGSRKSTRRSGKLFNAEMSSPQTPSGFSPDNDFRSSVNTSPIKSVKKGRGSPSNSLINNFNSTVLKMTEEFEDSLEENLTDLKDISPVNISKLGSARKSVRKSGNLTIDFTPGGEILLPQTNSLSLIKNSTKRSSGVSTRKINAYVNESVNTSGTSSEDSEMLNELSGNSDIESSNAVVTSPMNVTKRRSVCGKSTRISGNLHNNAEMISPKTPSRFIADNEISYSGNRSSIKSVKKSRGSISSDNDSLGNSQSNYAVLETSIRGHLGEESPNEKDITSMNISKLSSASRKSGCKSGNSIVDSTPGSEILLLQTNSASHSVDSTKRSSRISRKINASVNEPLNSSGTSLEDSEVLNELSGNSNVDTVSAVVTSPMNVSNLRSGCRKSTLSGNLYNDAEMASPKKPLRFSPDKKICSSVNKSPTKSVKKSVRSISSDNNSVKDSHSSSAVLETSDQFKDSLEESTNVKDISLMNVSRLGSALRKSVHKSDNLSINVLSSEHSMDCSILKTNTPRASTRKARSAQKHSPEIDNLCRKEKNLTEYKAKIAAKKLKMETPKSPDKKKMAALLVCHLKGRSSIKKKPLFSDILKTKPAAEAKAEKYSVPSAPNVTQRVIKKTLISGKKQVPARSTQGSTGHANSPAPIIIRNKVIKTPNIKRTRKGRKSVNCFATTFKPDIIDEDLQGVSNLFSTPAKFSANSSKNLNSPSRIFLDALELSSDDVKIEKETTDLFRRKSARNCVSSLSLALPASPLNNPISSATARGQASKKLLKNDLEGKSSSGLDSSSNYGTAYNSDDTVSQSGELLFCTPRLNKSVRFCESSTSSNEGTNLQSSSEADNSKLDTSVYSGFKSFVASSTKGSLRKTKSVSFMLDHSTNFDDITFVQTPNLSLSVLVSPLSSNIKQDTTVTDSKNLLNIRSVKSAKSSPLNITGNLKRLQRTRKSPKLSYFNVEGVKRLVRTPKSPKTNYLNVEGVKRLFRTPKSPKTNYTDVEGVKRLLKTPKSPKSNYPDDVEGVKRLLKTPKSPKSNYTNVEGVKRLLRTPKSPKSSYDDVDGIKNLLSTPTCSKFVSPLLLNKKEGDVTEDELKNIKGLQKMSKSPKSSYPVDGVRRLLRTPRSPKSSYLDVDGVKNCMSTPRSPCHDVSPVSSDKQERASDISNLEGTALVSSTKSTRSNTNGMYGKINQKTSQSSKFVHLDVEDASNPKSNYLDCSIDVTGVKRLFSTPKSPKSSYLDVKGVRQLLRSPRSPQSSYLAVEGVKKIFQISPIPDYSDVNIADLFKTNHQLDFASSDRSPLLKVEFPSPSGEHVPKRNTRMKRTVKTKSDLDDDKKMCALSEILLNSRNNVENNNSELQILNKSSLNCLKTTILDENTALEGTSGIMTRKRKVGEANKMKFETLISPEIINNSRNVSKSKTEAVSKKPEAILEENISKRSKRLQGGRPSGTRSSFSINRRRSSGVAAIIINKKRVQFRPQNDVCFISPRIDVESVVWTSWKSKKSSTPKKNLSLEIVEVDNKTGGRGARSKKTTSEVVLTRSSRRGKHTSQNTNVSLKMEIESKIPRNIEVTAVKGEEHKPVKRVMKRRGPKLESLPLASENKSKSTATKSENSSLEAQAGPSTQKSRVLCVNAIKAPKKSKAVPKVEDIEQENLSLTSEEEQPVRRLRRGGNATKAPKANKVAPKVEDTEQESLSSDGEEILVRRVRKTRNANATQASINKNVKSTSKKQHIFADESTNESRFDTKLKRTVGGGVTKASTNCKRNVKAEDIEQECSTSVSEDKKPVKGQRKKTSNKVVEVSARSTRSRKCNAANQEDVEVLSNAKSDVQRRRKRVELVDEGLSVGIKKRKISGTVDVNDSPNVKNVVRKLRNRAVDEKIPPKPVLTRSRRGRK